jgi:AcrR family transcriptional regulator
MGRIAEAGVAKDDPVCPFPSKDDLIVAYLERANERFWQWLEDVIADIGDPKDSLVAMFDAVGRLANDPQCLGCTFQGTAAEFPDPDHPGHRVALAHKQAVLARLRTLAQEAKLRVPRPWPTSSCCSWTAPGSPPDVRSRQPQRRGRGRGHHPHRRARSPDRAGRAGKGLLNSTTTRGVAPMAGCLRRRRRG